VELVGSERYREACLGMIRRECPGCTCGIHLSLAYKNAASPLAHIHRYPTEEPVVQLPGSD
jgi:hypothetical protein